MYADIFYTILPNVQSRTGQHINMANASAELKSVTVLLLRVTQVNSSRLDHCTIDVSVHVIRHNVVIDLAIDDKWGDKQ